MHSSWTSSPAPSVELLAVDVRRDPGKDLRDGHRPGTRHDVGVVCERRLHGLRLREGPMGNRDVLDFSSFFFCRRRRYSRTRPADASMLGRTRWQRGGDERVVLLAYPSFCRRLQHNGLLSDVG